MGALVAATVAIRQGNRQATNTFLRWRVILQGVTVVSMLAGSFYFAETRRRERLAAQERDAKLQEERRAAKKAKMDAAK